MEADWAYPAEPHVVVQGWLALPGKFAAWQLHPVRNCPPAAHFDLQTRSVPCSRSSPGLTFRLGLLCPLQR